MAKVIFILGLLGSGKSTLIEKMQKLNPNLYAIDEGFNPDANPDFNEKFLKVKENISKGYDCAIVEIEMCREPFRSRIAKMITGIQGVEIEYQCFENNLTKANANLSKPGQRDPKGRKGINSFLHPQYTFPTEYKRLTIKTS